jgi:signal peptidase I
MSSDRPGGPADVVPGDAGEPGDGRSETSVPASRFSRRLRRKEQQQSKGSLLRELPVLLLVAFVLALLVKTFLVQAFFIPSGSMEQTLHGCVGCTGDRVLVNKVPYWFSGEPEPVDIVVFTGPDTWSPEIQVEEPTNWFTGGLLWLGRTVGVAPPSEDDFIKRVIATEGQTVRCCDPEGRVTVDDEPLDEPYIFEDSPIESRAFEAVTVPEGRLWVMGDHRSASADSKAHIDDKYSGTIGVEDVIGKASVIVWPPSRIGLLDDPDIQGTEAAGAPATPGIGQVTASSVVPGAVGVGLTVPIAWWRARRRSR